MFTLLFSVSPIIALPLIVNTTLHRRKQAVESNILEEDVLQVPVMWQNFIMFTMVK